MTQKPTKYQLVRQQISTAEQDWARPEDAVQLLAVSKTRSAGELQITIDQGQQAFGENYLQEALDKIAALKQNSSLIWHFIGSIQSNKTRSIAEHFDWVHSIERLKIAQRLNDQRPDNMPPLNVLIQINISEESSKSGIDAQEFLTLSTNIAKLPRLQLRGIMGLPTPADNFDAQRIQCDQLFKLYRTLQEQMDGIDTLSMGTTADLEAAIAAGSTMVRVGTAIFGPRNYPQI